MRSVTTKRALEVVLGLAKENVLEEDQVLDDVMEKDREDQLSCVAAVEDFLAEFVDADVDSKPAEPSKFKVDLCRTGYRSATIYVVARSIEEASKMAMEMVVEHDFSNDYDVDYSVIDVEPLE